MMESVEIARSLLRGEDPFGESTSDSERPARIVGLARELASRNQITYARRVLERAVELDGADALRRRVKQLLALYTSKDLDLPPDRHDRALAILEGVEPLSKSTDPESLGIAGGIYKRKWYRTYRKADLERSLACYEKGLAGGVDDDGYTAINTAFALDLLADLEEREAAVFGTEAEDAGSKRRRAQGLRRGILETLVGKPAEGWWHYATLAEAALGVGESDRAGAWLEEGVRDAPPEPWERQSTARQLADLVGLHADAWGPAAESRAWQALRPLSDSPAALRALHLGRVGLALSGGGFRASLFHLGVLARLAELDLLRHVEVLSCVSGGSIVGAHYYVRLREILESEPDGAIDRRRYVQMVEALIDQFLAGVQANIRTRVAASFTTNLRMAFRSDYSRTHRAGELFEERLYGAEDPIPIPELLIRPEGESEGFHPKYENWRRWSKVPMLILNATTLNTGHNWQFTGRSMGEPPGACDPEVQVNALLRRMWHEDAPEGHRRTTLGTAVAASACVPGLFDPIALSGLFPGITVRLVDGGVHDNQGVVGLVEQDCGLVLVSDGSGQMDTDQDPAPDPLHVLLRSNSVLMTRVRQAQYRDLEARRDAETLRDLMFVHLKGGLEEGSIDTIDSPDRQREERVVSESTRDLRKHVRPDVQRGLAAIRTDLDSFCDAEAYALMSLGYRMTEVSLPTALSEMGDHRSERVDWPFLAIEDAMREDGDARGRERLRRILAVANQRAFKVWRLSPLLKACGIAVGLIVLALAVGAVWALRGSLLQWVGAAVLVLLALALVTLARGALARATRLPRAVFRAAMGLSMAFFGSFAAWIHLLVFDRLYLRYGRIDHWQVPAAESTPPPPHERS